MSDLRKELIDFLYKIHYGDFSIEALESWVYDTPALEGFLGPTLYKDLLDFDYWQPRALKELCIKIAPLDEYYFPEGDLWRERVRRLLCSLRNPATDHISVCWELGYLQVEHSVTWLPSIFEVIADRYSEYPHPRTHQYWHPDSLAKEMIGYEEFMSRSRVQSRQAAEKVLAEQYPEEPCN
jgi:hypothetical protein